MKDLATILAELRVLQPELKKRYPIREMGVFGSYVRGEQREDSDLDVLVDLGNGMTLIDLAGLQLELGEALGLKVESGDEGRAEAAHREARSRRGRDALKRDTTAQEFAQELMAALPPIIAEMGEPEDGPAS